jgi:hypothetical protein
MLYNVPVVRPVIWFVVPPPPVPTIWDPPAAGIALVCQPFAGVGISADLVLVIVVVVLLVGDQSPFAAGANG